MSYSLKQCTCIRQWTCITTDPLKFMFAQSCFETSRDTKPKAQFQLFDLHKVDKQNSFYIKGFAARIALT